MVRDLVHQDLIEELVAVGPAVGGIDRDEIEDRILNSKMGRQSNAAE